jgi:sulfopyruvate decarboxylase subunit beta
VSGPRKAKAANDTRPEREKAIEAVFSKLPQDALVICANGHIGREAHRVNDRLGNFYMIGSMGLAASIGLGVALTRPERLVVILDGDGNVLMGMGTLASVVANKPKRFLHVCLDNAEYTSTGGQKTISGVVKLEDVARGAGYAHAERAKDLTALARAVEGGLKKSGPTFILAEVAAGEPADLAPRVKHEPPEMVNRFRKASKDAATAGAKA